VIINYPLGVGRPNARSSDPNSSHLANHAIKHNARLADHILLGVLAMSGEHPEGVTDDHLLYYIEDVTQKRQQRNVIARTRGLLEQDGWLTRMPNTKRVAVRQSEQLINYLKEHHASILQYQLAHL